MQMIYGWLSERSSVTMATNGINMKRWLIAITVEEPLRRYCQRIRRPDFWGGEAELLVLSKLCCQHIVVYIPEHEVLHDNLKLILDFKHSCKVGILSCWPPSSSFKLITRGKEGQGQSPGN